MPGIIGRILRISCFLLLVLSIAVPARATVSELHEVKFKVQGVLKTADGTPVAGAELILLLENPEKLGKDGIIRRLMMQRMQWQSDPTQQPDTVKLATMMTPGMSSPSGYFTADTSRRYEKHRSWFPDWFSRKKQPFKQAWLVVWKDGRLLKPVQLDCSRWQQVPKVQDLKSIIITAQVW